MRIRENAALSFDDVLLVPKNFNGRSRKEINLKTKIAGLKLNLPLISANMNFAGPGFAIELASLGGLPIFSRMKSLEDQCNDLVTFRYSCEEYVGASIGINEFWKVETEELITHGADLICLDVAHADQKRVYEVYEEFRSRYPTFPLIIGNYAQPAWFASRAMDQYTAWKVGVGGGSLCTTRIQTGCGVPTLQSVIDCTEPPRQESKGGIIADGGFKSSGDIVKALAAGASAVMLGSLFAGCTEAEGKTVKDKTGRKFKSYLGNASEGSKAAAGMTSEFIEGVETLVPHSGPLKQIVRQLEDGIRSGFSYCGAIDLKQLQDNAEFIKISPAGYRESLPHGVL